MEGISDARPAMTGCKAASWHQWEAEAEAEGGGRVVGLKWMDGFEIGRSVGL